MAGRILDNKKAFFVRRVGRVSLVEVGAELFVIITGSHTVDDIVLFLGVEENGVDVFDRASIFLNPETDAKTVAVTVDVVVVAVFGDAQVRFCLGVSLGNLHRTEERIARSDCELVCAYIEIRDDGQVTVIVARNLVERKRVAVLVQENRVLEVCAERNRNDHRIESLVAVELFSCGQGFFRHGDCDYSRRDFELFAGNKVPLDVSRRSVATGALDERDVREFCGRDFFECDCSCLDVALADAGAVERTCDAERVALVKIVRAEVEFEACILFELCFGDVERLQVRLVFFDGDRLVGGLRVFRIADLQGIVTGSDAVDGVLAVFVRGGGLDGGHAGGNVRCRNQVHPCACSGRSVFVDDDACDGRAGFCFREYAGVVLVGAGGEKRCEGKNPCYINNLKVHHALTSGSRLENRCKFIW